MKDGKKGVETMIMGVGIYIVVFFLAANIVIGWLMAYVFKYFWTCQKGNFSRLRAVILMIILLPFASFWGILAINQTKVLDVFANDKYSKILLPKVTTYAHNTQRQVSSLLKGSIFDTSRQKRYLWLLFANPITQLVFLYFVFKGKNKFEKQLDRYFTRCPDNIDFKAVKKEAENKTKVRGQGFTLLGYNYKTNTPAIITDEERLRHVQIIGGTGSGKTSSLIFPMMKQDIERDRGIIFVDAKGDLNTAKTIYQMARDAGRGDDFQIFSMGFPEKSNSYNPLALGNATQLKDKIIGAIAFTEPHYKRECENGLQILFDELINAGKTVTLSALNEILKKPSLQFPNFLDFYNEHKKNITGIQNEINLIVNTQFGRLFEGNEINLSDVYNKQKIVYFALNVLIYGETGKRMGRLITGDINTLCGTIQNSEHRKELGIFIDEYGAFGTEPFALTLSQGRSAKFMVTIAHQSKADLKNISQNHDEQIKTNTNTRIVLKSSNTDAEDFSNEAGTYRGVEITRQVALKGTKEGAEMGTEKVVDVYHINPQEIRQLNTGQAAYKTPSEMGLVKLKYFGYSDDVLSGISLPEKKAVSVCSNEADNNKDIKEVKSIFQI